MHSPPPDAPLPQRRRTPDRWSSNREHSPALLEPRSTPRQRSRTRPGNGVVSPSPIVRRDAGESYRSSGDHSTAAPPPATRLAPAAGPSRSRLGTSRGAAGPSAHVDAARLGDGSGSWGLAASSASPLALALRAQWTLVHEQLEAGGGAAAASSSSPAMRATEKELLRALRALPASDTAVVLRQAADIAPYLLGFSAAPVPSVRTQAVALAALQGIVDALPAEWGRAAAADFVQELFLGGNEALAAFEMALARAVADKAADENDFAVTRRRRAMAGRGAIDDESAAVQRAVQREAVVDSLLAVLFSVCVLSSAVAGAALGASTLLSTLVQLLPQVSAPSQAASAAGLLQALLNAPAPTAPFHRARSDGSDTGGVGGGPRAAERAAVLAGYGVHHAVLRCLRASVRATHNGHGDVAAHTSVTALCLHVRLATQLVAADNGAFATLVQEDGFAVLVGQLLTLPWGEVVEGACLLAAAVVARFPLREGRVFAENLLAKDEAVRALSRLLGWRGEETFSYATSAALCWRWLFLAGGGGGHTPGADAPAAVEVAVAEPGTLLSLLHAIMTMPALARERPSLASRPEFLLFRVELVVAVAAAFAAGSEYTRAAMQLLLGERLDAEAAAVLRGCVGATLDAVDDSYFASFPALAVEAGTALAEHLARTTTSRAGRRAAKDDGRSERRAASAHSSRRSSSRNSRAGSREGGLFRSNYMSKRAEEEGEEAEGEGEGVEEEGAQIVCTGAQWRAVVRCSWEMLLSSDRHDGAADLSLSASDRRGGRLAVPGRETANLSVTAGRGSSMRSPQLQQLPNAAAPPTAASSASPAAAEHELSALQLTTAKLQRRREMAAPLPAHFSCAVVERAAVLADAGEFYRESIRVILRLAHQYVRSGVVGQPQLPTTATAAAARSGAGGADRQFEDSAFSLLLEREPRYLPLVLAHEETAVGRARGAAAGRDDNPWAPPRRVGPSRRWRVADLQRSDVLLFVLSYEDLVADLAEAVGAVEAHVDHLRRQLQVCPTREMTRRMVLRDLYANVYPKLHMFLRYLQHQLARSRATLQLLATVAEQHPSYAPSHAPAIVGGGGLCVSSANILDVYEAVGHCVGDGGAEHVR